MTQEVKIRTDSLPSAEWFDLRGKIDISAVCALRITLRSLAPDESRASNVLVGAPCVDFTHGIFWRDLPKTRALRGQWRHPSPKAVSTRGRFDFWLERLRFKLSAAAFGAASGVVSGNPFRMCTYINTAVNPLEYALTDC